MSAPVAVGPTHVIPKGPHDPMDDVPWVYMYWLQPKIFLQEELANFVLQSEGPRMSCVKEKNLSDRLESEPQILS